MSVLQTTALTARGPVAERVTGSTKALPLAGEISAVRRGLADAHATIPIVPPRINALIDADLFALFRLPQIVQGSQAEMASGARVNSWLAHERSGSRAR